MGAFLVSGGNILIKGERNERFGGSVAQEVLRCFFLFLKDLVSGKSSSQKLHGITKIF
jgi:hypothetical protein